MILSYSLLIIEIQLIVVCLLVFNLLATNFFSFFKIFFRTLEMGCPENSQNVFLTEHDKRRIRF